MVDQVLLTAATHVVNHRSKGRDRDLATLAAAGVPTEWHELRKWLATETRNQLQEQCYWFRGRSMRVDNGSQADLPVYGRFAAVIDCVKPLAAQSDDDGGDPDCAWRWHAAGISGTAESYEAAMTKAEGVLRQNGYTRDWHPAAEVAKSQAKARHEEKMQSPAYAKKFGATV